MSVRRHLGLPRTDDRILSKLTPVIRHKVLFLLTVLAVIAAAFAVSRLQTKTYSASATLLFRDPSTTPALLGQTNQSAAVDPTQQAATNLRLASLPRISRLVARQFPGTSAHAIQAETVVSPDGQSNVVDVTVTDPSPVHAARLATAYAGQAIDVRRQADQASLLQTLALVRASFNKLSPADRRASVGRQLQIEANQLSIRASLQTGQAELVQAGQIPTSPASVGTGVILVLGLLLGVTAAFGLTTLLDHTDRRIHTLDELAALIDSPIMGSVPRRLRADHDRDAFNTIKTNLRYMPENVVKSVLISSSEAAEGKTTIAWNLATAAAASGAPTLLIEADLRRPTIASDQGLQADAGLVDALAGLVRWQDAVVDLPVAGDSCLHLLLAGRVPPNPTALLTSDVWTAILAQASREYTLIVVDSAPIGLVPDAVPLAAACDATLIVAQLKRVRRDRLPALLSRLESIGVRGLGVVANYSRRSSGYAYNYTPQASSGVRGTLHHNPLNEQLEDNLNVRSG